MTSLAINVYFTGLRVTGAIEATLRRAVGAGQLTKVLGQAARRRVKQTLTSTEASGPFQTRIAQLHR